MKRVLLAISIILSVSAHDPWHIDPSSKAKLQKHIWDVITKDREIFGAREGVLISKIKLPESKYFQRCHMPEESPDCLQMFSEKGFEISNTIPLEGHCFGTSLSFLRFLFENPNFTTWSLQEVYDQFYAQNSDELNIHELSLCQPANISPMCYLIGCNDYKRLAKRKFTDLKKNTLLLFLKRSHAL
jgi:hypothetical protein